MDMRCLPGCALTREHHHFNCINGSLATVRYSCWYAQCCYSYCVILCDDRSIDILTPRHKSADTQAGIHATPANLDSGPYADGVTQSTSTGLRPQYGYIDHTDYYYKSYKKKRGIDGTLLVLFTHYTNWKVFAPVISWPTISLLLTYFCPPS